MTGLEDPSGINLDLAVAPGVCRYRAWVRGRDENRVLLANWLDGMSADDHRAPAAVEEWLIQLELTDQRDPHPAPRAPLTANEIAEVARARWLKQK